MGAPFLTLLFEKEAEQVPFVPMPATIKGMSNNVDTPKVADETYETNEFVEETERPINVLGMTPDLLNLEGGYVRYCTYHSISDDTYEEQDQLYYGADGNMVLDCLYNEDGVLISSDYFIYDEEGRVLREELWNTHEYSRGLYRIYTYGPNGVEQMDEGQFEDEPEHYHVYEYDDQGRLVRDYTAFPNHDPHREHIYTYEDL
ncbi:MAG: hypothetical protein K6C38_08805 [Saccharofermentans sp.]|nr:hypothetical protein [Saccharofermentans sp.]